MEQTIIKNDNGAVNSLQVSCLENVPQGNSNFGRGVLLKNITDSEISVSVKLLNNKNSILTILYPGWNPEIVVEITNAPANSLQFGY